MPTMTSEELEFAIRCEAIGAVTLDTSIFDQYGDDLRNQALLSLRQFKGTNIAIVFSDIVISEVKTHISRRAAETVVGVLKALKDHRRAWRLDETPEQLGSCASLDGSATELAEGQLAAYIATVEATIISADNHVNIRELQDRYFAGQPPFSGNGKKKAEFPDALALMALGAWAKSKNTTLLAVSDDDDWHRFAAESKHIVCARKLPEVLDQFNRDNRFIADRVVTLLREGQAPFLNEGIFNAVELFFDDNSFEIAASNPNYGYDATLQGGALQYWTYAGRPQVLTASKDDLTFVLDLNCKIAFEASFSWSVYGDRDWHEVGSTDASCEGDYRLQFTITCSRTTDEDPDVDEVKVTSRPFTIDFGYVDPDWDYEE